MQNLQSLRDARQVSSDVGRFERLRVHPPHHQKSFALPVLHDLWPRARLRGSDRVEVLEVTIDVQDRRALVRHPNDQLTVRGANAVVAVGDASVQRGDLDCVPHALQPRHSGTIMCDLIGRVACDLVGLLTHDARP